MEQKVDTGLGWILYLMGFLIAATLVGISVKLDRIASALELIARSSN